MAGRKWRSWPTRFGRALTETGGFVGIAGIAISIAGVTTAAPAVVIIGVATIGGAMVYAGIRGIPPKMQSAAELVGTNVSLDALATIDPPILKLGIVGCTRAGKTTFIKQALAQIPQTSRTNKVYAVILALQTHPPIYVALLDGDGEQLPQQFEVAENADFLLIFLDHNQGHDNIAKSKERIEEHDRFIKQIEYHIRRRKPLSHLHLVLNKRDLWERSRSSDELRSWFAAHVEACQNAHIATQVTSDIHSNMTATDIGKVLREIAARAATT